ncbi:Glycosyltransferase, family GT2 [Tenacibaculum sp. 190524A02b]|uniref:glycosyltransferase n=1 Tax=Tenacibaculum vairaonense TaxID=3137860 RepID=UPI0032B286C3
MTIIKNIFICLVHENQDCIIDLVRNLKYSDPTSKIILYNGGTNIDLFKHFPFHKYDVIIFPNPKPLQWGWLHDFAIDCMEYAVDNMEFDTITIVDSDQLACKKNYSSFIADTFSQNPNLGMLGQIPDRLPIDTEIHPAVTAYKEKELWQPFLNQLPNGKDAFLHWTFWPSTVFTYNASKDLVLLFRNNTLLQELLKTTKIWASEEILLPTLTIALGYTIVKNPCTYDYVKYKTEYTTQQIQQAIDKKTCYWIHPVSRDVKDINRKYVRNAFSNYILPYSPINKEILSLINTIQIKTNPIEGWLNNDELALLVELAFLTAKRNKKPVFLEIGSYCGKATSVISLTAQHINKASKIVAIDNFTGRLGAEDATIDQYPPSYDKFYDTLNKLEIAGMIEVIKVTPHLTNYTTKVDLILIDGLHDYASVARDFYHFEKLFKKDTLILFHDYCTSFPGVLSFVNELINQNSYQILKQSSSLIALQKSVDNLNLKEKVKPLTYKKQNTPLVSCIMPTYNRPEFIENAVQQFLNQTYANKELIIIDDSESSIKQLIPENPAIRYVHIDKKLDIGSKRNMACQMSNGAFIIHLDDDDFYATNWIEKQITFLIDNNLDITGLSSPCFYEPLTSKVSQYKYPLHQRKWVYGATLCYTYQFWKSNPFPNINCGEDNAFVWASSSKKICPNHEAISLYIGHIHSKNTSPKQTQDKRWFDLKLEDFQKTFKYKNIKSIPIFNNTITPIKIQITGKPKTA